MTRRSLSLKSGHSIGLLNEGIELASFENTDLPNTIAVRFHAKGEYANISVSKVGEKSKTKIEGKIYYLRKDEIIYFGENVSILMTRHNYGDFRIVIETQDTESEVYVQKNGKLFRLGRQDDPNEHSFKLYAVSKSYQQGRSANRSKTSSY